MASVRSNVDGPTGSGTDTVFTAPSGITNGDLLLAIFRTGANVIAPTVNPPAGFTQVAGFPITQTNSPDTFQSLLYAYQKIANNESGNYTFSHSTGFRDGMMYCIRDVDQSTPFSPNPTKTNGSGATITATGLTTPNDNSLVIIASLSWDVAGPANPPTGYTERHDPPNVIYVADQVIATAGAVTGPSFTSQNNTGSPWDAVLFSIKNAAIANYNLAANQGNFSLTYNDATLIYSPAATYTLVADQGNFSSIYNSIGLNKGYNVQCNFGNFITLGVNVQFLYNRQLNCIVGSFVTIGNNANMYKNDEIEQSGPIIVSCRFENQRINVKGSL